MRIMSIKKVDLSNAVLSKGAMLGAGKMTAESTVSTLLFDELPAGRRGGHAE